jgi:hypothetical protein
MKFTGRHGWLWIFGRIGILIVFGIMPLIRIRERVRTAPLREAYRKSIAAYDETWKYPTLSEGWNTNKAAGDYWLGEGNRLSKKLYGK